MTAATADARAAPQRLDLGAQPVALDSHVGQGDPIAADLILQLLGAIAQVVG